MAKKSNVSQIKDYMMTKQAEEKLASSGLSLDDAKLLKIDTLSIAETTAFLPEPMREKNTLGSLKFNYHGLDGAPVVDRASGQPYWRIRVLGDHYESDAPVGPTPVGAFGSVASPSKPRKKAPRYFQAAGTLAHPYFPTNLNRAIFYRDDEDWVEIEVESWADVATDPDIPIILTEGELKAAKACKEGFACIGLGGVTSWKNSRHGDLFLPELETDVFAWHSRRVYICFDSDLYVNTNVVKALEGLAQRLIDRGADVYIALLPSDPGIKELKDKVGLDDFLTYMPDAVNRLCEILVVAPHMKITRSLFKLNERYMYVKGSNQFIMDRQQSDLPVCSAAQFKDAEGNNIVALPVIKAGHVTYEETSIAPIWMRWPLRKTVDGLVYQPCRVGEEEEFIETEAGVFFNTWRGYGCQPKPGDISPFMKLIDHLFEGGDPGAKDWFLRWLAYPLQHPCSNMLTAAVLWGPAHGTGKTLIGKAMGRIYGRNYSKITQRELHNAFNFWAHNKQFVMGEEITDFGNKRDDSNMLKDLITGDDVSINRKHMAQYTIANYINFLFTSNHSNAFYLDDQDRRFFIHEVQVEPLPRDFYRRELRAWEEADGASHLFDYLLSLDLGDMHKDDRAMETSAKRNMIANVRTDLADWVALMKVEPDSVLRLDGVVIKDELMSSNYLVQIFNLNNNGTVKANTMGTVMADRGFKLVNGGTNIKYKDKTGTYKASRYYIIRNHEKWLKADHAAASEYLRQLDLSR